MQIHFAVLFKKEVFNPWQHTVMYFYFNVQIKYQQKYIKYRRYLIITLQFLIRKIISIQVIYNRKLNIIIIIIILIMLSLLYVTDYDDDYYSYYYPYHVIIIYINYLIFKKTTVTGCISTQIFTHTK